MRPILKYIGWADQTGVAQTELGTAVNLECCQSMALYVSNNHNGLKLT